MRCARRSPMTPAYDIFKKASGANIFVWIEAAEGIVAAKKRLLTLVSTAPAEPLGLRPGKIRPSHAARRRIQFARQLTRSAASSAILDNGISAQRRAGTGREQ